ncbi:unnamed protein product [Rodentolepis nana]|uniref:CHHC U11-48K-type domain-containing protein n=1 Tax=Rodentolepis nana TaxID=102285 RepID=A0A0R3T8C8_RODNA|nr:unnamed protein product [Rodentolepis nana]
MEKTHLIRCSKEEMEKTHLIRCLAEEMVMTHLIRCPALKTTQTHLIRCPALKTRTWSLIVKPTGGNGEDPSDSLQEKMEKTHLIRCSDLKDPPDLVSSPIDKDGKPKILGSKKTANELLAINCYKCAFHPWGS